MSYNRGDDMFFYQLRQIMDPFMDVLTHTWIKLLLAVAWMTGWSINFGVELFHTPELMAEGLGWLVFLDWIAGNFRAATDNQIKWHIGRWRRTFVKIGMYGIVCGGVTVAANMFGGPFTYFQIGTFAFFAGLEIYSLFRLTGFTAVFWVMVDLVLEKNSWIDLSVDDVKRMIRSRAHREYYNHED